MKVAFDEHIPPALIRVFQVLADEGYLPGYKFVSARNYHDFENDQKNDDRPWLQRFADDGGTIVISGNSKMRGKMHERQLLADAGFIVIFLGDLWHNTKGGTAQASFVLRWWKPISDFLSTNPKGPSFKELPSKWTGSSEDFRDVTGPHKKG